jgi:integrase/recombinase XerD
LADIRLKDLDRDERQIQVRGKRDKIHTAHYQPRVDGLLAKWIDGLGKGSGRPHTRYADESPYLFPTDYSEKIAGSTINDVVVQAAKNAGIQEVVFTDAADKNHYRVTSHTLRHSFAMHYLQEGGSIEALSKLLAHSSVVVTEIYGEVLDERAGREYDEFAPDPLADSEFTI